MTLMHIDRPVHRILTQHEYGHKTLRNILQIF